MRLQSLMVSLVEKGTLSMAEGASIIESGTPDCDSGWTASTLPLRFWTER
jgi:hypothetical protein